ncbi:NUDIX hydrolase [archaeon]|nr:NUDIX hydrolase [archaeon]MBL7056917.1 NUDIX hydrolase [Candidatus Woesearchaeota archaeon]
MIDHPWIGIDAIILNEDKTKILLIKRGSKAYHGFWGFVSGLPEWGEEVKEAVIREAKEETNLDVEIVKFIGKYYDKRGRHPTKTMYCLPHICKVVGGELKADDDALDAKWFDLAEVKDMELAFDHKQILIDEGLI